MIHTPGPWHISHNVFGTHGIVDSNNKEIIGHLYVGGYEEEANAYLIAAAPDLLETSEALLNDVRRRYPEIETNGFSCPFFRAIEQAIAKARGVS